MGMTKSSHEMTPDALTDPVMTASVPVAHPDFQFVVLCPSSPEAKEQTAPVQGSDQCRLWGEGGIVSRLQMMGLFKAAHSPKFLWAPPVDNVRIPLLGRFGQRREPRRA
jgi:hypothetical protein